MKIVFAHDHWFFSWGKAVFSRGGLPYSVLSRYSKVFGSVLVFARVKRAKENPVKLAVSSGAGVDFVRVRNIKSLTGIFLLPIEIYKIFKFVKESDGVICRLPSVIGALVFLASRIHRKPSLVEVVGNGYEAAAFHGSKFSAYYARLIHALTAYCVKNSEFVVYITESYLQNVYPAKNKVFTCSNVFLPENLILEKRDVEVKSSNFLNRLNSGDAINLCLVGSLDVNYKGHATSLLVLEDLIKFYGLGDRVVLNFVGPGNPSKWRKMAKELGVQNNLIIHGVIAGPNKMFDFLDAMDVMIQPSETEAQGRVIVEAMSRGLPVVASCVGGIPELLSACCVFHPKDYKSFSRKLFKIITEADEYRSLAIENHCMAKAFGQKEIDEKRFLMLSEFREYCSERKG